MAISNAAWARGMAELVACCQDRELGADVLGTRGVVYRADLGHLSDERWRFAVAQARKERWFPTIRELLDYASAMPESAAERERRDAHLQRQLAPGSEPEPERMVTPPLALYEALVFETPPPQGAAPAQQQLAYCRLIAEQAGVPMEGPLGRVYGFGRS